MTIKAFTSRESKVRAWHANRLSQEEGYKITKEPRTDIIKCQQQIGWWRVQIPDT